jgi:hypothetical protein
MNLREDGVDALGGVDAVVERDELLLGFELRLEGLYAILLLDGCQTPPPRPASLADSPPAGRFAQEDPQGPGKVGCSDGEPG